MIQAIAKALLVIFAYPLLPKNLDINHESTFRERLFSKKKENFIWLLVWYAVMMLFFFLFVSEVKLGIVSMVFLGIWMLMFQQETIVLFFLGALVLEPVYILVFPIPVVMYLALVFVLFALSQVRYSQRE